MKRNISIMLIVILSLALLAGCSGQVDEGIAEETGAVEEESGSSEQEDNDSNEAIKITVGIPGDALSLDPYVNSETITNSLVQHMYEGLVLADQDMQIIPGLAESWELSDDLLTWTFNLRKGVKFHNGNEFNADDVIFSFDRGNSDVSRYKYVFSTVESYEKVDDYTVKVHSKSPNVIFLTTLRGLVIMDKETFEGQSDDFIALNPVGTGRYIFSEHVTGDHITFVKNEEYWGELSQVDEVTYKPITNDATRTANILTGSVDMVVDVPVRDVEILKTKDDISIIQQPSLRNIYLNLAGWTDNPSPDAENKIVSPKGDNPLKSIDVRKAIYHAINEDEIIDKVMNGFATPATTYSPENYVGYNQNIKRLSYDPSLAAKLLDNAGYPIQESGELEGYRFQITFDAPNDRYINDAQIATAIAGYLEKVGIKVNLNLMSRSVFFKYIRPTNPMGDNTHFLLSGWSSSSGESVGMAIDLLYSNTQEGPVKEGYGGVNRGYYQNPEIDELIDEAMRTKDVKKRGEIVSRIWELATDDVAFIPLHFQQDVFAVKDGIEYTPRANKYVYAWDFKVNK